MTPSRYKSAELPQVTTNHSEAFKPHVQSTTTSREDFSSTLSSSSPMTLEQQQTQLRELGVSIVEDTTHDEVLVVVIQYSSV